MTRLRASRFGEAGPLPSGSGAAHPPLLAERALVVAVGDAEWADAIAGDLREEFVEMTRRHGASYARRWYWAQALGVAAHRLTARVRRPRRASAMFEPDPPDTRAGLLARVAHDLKGAWRSLRHQPALAATVVLVLGLALAANATIFAIADAIVLRPFRYPGVGRAVLVVSDANGPFFDRTSVAPGDYLDWRDEAGGVLDRLAAIEWWEPQYLQDGPPQQLTGFKVSPGLFEIMGEAPVLGRTLATGDASQVPPAVIGFEFWRRQFGGRADVLGTRLRLDGVIHEVVGVMPASFSVPFGADVWAPLELAPDARADRRRQYLAVIGRRASGVTIAQVQQRLDTILADQRRAFPDTHSKRSVTAFDYVAGSRDPGAAPFIAIWQIAAVVLLVVACANVANLLLARNSEREREFSVRLALGASGTALAWQLLIEGLLLAGTAAAVAVPLASIALGLTRSAFPASVIRFVPGFAHLEIEPRTFAATTALAAAAVLLFAVTPALRASRQNVTAGLRIGGRLTEGAKRQRGRAVLAGAQLALTLALLVAAGLSLRALYRVTEGPLGFDATNVLVGRVSLSGERYADPEPRRRMVERVLARLDALPAVTRSAVTNVLPYSGEDFQSRFWPEDVPPREADASRAGGRSVTPPFFTALGIPLVSGRLLDASDRADATPVAVVSRSMAERFWPNQSPLGKRFRTAPDGPLIEVVGIVGDVAQHWLVDPIRPSYYRPVAQQPPVSFHIVLRTVTDPVQLSASLRAAVQAEDAELPVVGIRTMEGVIEDQTVGLRFAGRTLGVIAVVSAVLASVGIYSLMAFLFGRRTREMGVRMALGATRGDVIRLACRQALRLTLAGVAVGLVLAFFVSRGLESAMFGVITTSPALVAGVAALLTAIGLLASYVPARRVSRVEPTVALRAE